MPSCVYSGNGFKNMLTPWKLLLCQVAMNIFYHVVKAGLCLGGHDIFGAVRENSPTGEFVADINMEGNTGTTTIRLCLTGENANWFFLEGQSIRLNSSYTRGLDREVLGSVLMASLTCYEDDIIQSEYRIMVEILNENDNKPRFVERTIQPLYISELTAINSEAFAVKAKDADGDTILYILDLMSPDANYFRIDLPNSGKVILDKPLDFETKTQLEVVIYAVEMNTGEKYNTTATIIVNVLDGDDQYPIFLPCTPISQDQADSICTNPLYTVNITEKEQDSVLHFSPGPIHAEDGDKDIRVPLSYTLLSGDDHGRFMIDNETGQITLTRRVENRLLTPTYTIRIMAAQENDPKKYTVATALVHVQADNRFPPHFNKTTYKGFVIDNTSPATLVSTYGNEVLVVQAIDRDFRDGVNPRMTYSLAPKGLSTNLYHITQGGILIAKTDLLQPSDRHILKVEAMDQETGETAQTSVDIEVLQKGQSVPRSQFGEERLFGDIDASLAGGIAGVILLLAAVVLCLLIRMMRRWRGRHDPADRSHVARGKHPNVVNSGRPVPLIEEFSYNNEAYHDNEADFNSLCGKEGNYTIRDEISLRPPSIMQFRSREHKQSRKMNDMFPILVMPEPSSFILANGGAMEKALDKSASFSEGTYGRDREDSLTGEGEICRLERRHTAGRIESRGDSSMLTQFGPSSRTYETGQRRESEVSEVLVPDNLAAGCEESYESCDEEIEEEEVMEEDGDKENVEEETNPYSFKSILPFRSTDEEDATVEERPRIIFKFKRPRPPRALREREPSSTPKHEESQANHTSQTSVSLPKEDSEEQENQDPDTSLRLCIEDGSSEV
ncbi:cadherin-related family member 5 isoform X3 [Clupea harengus]|uniref:Cadherin-related family member 5 isoform X3 n=1 Tax=Clupea harengus TaxID=7950 RepID=A0A6P8GJD4_CLUHA|nr:cadherin-related family member 5 isoform X3 [Clupea harengus]